MRLPPVTAMLGLPLATHGYVDLDYPDRSALVFAPDPSGSKGRLLQVWEIRNLHLKAKLVTLSVCVTCVGQLERPASTINERPHRGWCRLGCTHTLGVGELLTADVTTLADGYGTHYRPS